MWFVLAGMATCAVVAAVWPLFRASAAANADPVANETAFYKAQLKEIRRELERGLLPQGEAESARAARRLIAAASGPSPGRRRRPGPLASAPRP